MKQTIINDVHNSIHGFTGVSKNGKVQAERYPWARRFEQIRRRVRDEEIAVSSEFRTASLFKKWYDDIHMDDWFFYVMHGATEVNRHTACLIPRPLALALRFQMGRKKASKDSKVLPRGVDYKTSKPVAFRKKSVRKSYRARIDMDGCSISYSYSTTPLEAGRNYIEAKHMHILSLIDGFLEEYPTHQYMEAFLHQTLENIMQTLYDDLGVWELEHAHKFIDEKEAA